MLRRFQDGYVRHDRPSQHGCDADMVDAVLLSSLMTIVQFGAPCCGPATCNQQGKVAQHAFCILLLHVEHWNFLNLSQGSKSTMNTLNESIIPHFLARWLRLNESIV